jgi:hypothetical protein
VVVVSRATVPNLTKKSHRSCTSYLIFDRVGASKAQLKSRLRIFDTTRHCLSCERIVQKKNEAGDWVMTDTSGEHKVVMCVREGSVPFPRCTVTPLNPAERLARRKARTKKVYST